MREGTPESNTDVGKILTRNNPFYERMSHREQKIERIAFGDTVDQ